jgi:hypothetical protein
MDFTGLARISSTDEGHWEGNLRRCKELLGIVVRSGDVWISDFGLLLAALSRERSGLGFGLRPSDLRLHLAPRPQALRPLLVTKNRRQATLPARS